MNLVHHVDNLSVAPTLDTPKSSNTRAHEEINNCARCMQEKSGAPRHPQCGQSDGERG